MWELELMSPNILTQMRSVSRWVAVCWDEPIIINSRQKGSYYRKQTREGSFITGDRRLLAMNVVSRIDEMEHPLYQRTKEFYHSPPRFNDRIGSATRSPLLRNRLIGREKKIFKRDEDSQDEIINKFIASQDDKMQMTFQKIIWYLS